MKRIRYYFSRLAGLDYKNMWKTATEIARIKKSFRILILIDMIWSSIRYQAGYSEYFEYEFYLLNAKQRRTFITAIDANTIIQKYNKREDRQFFSDKTQFNKVFKDYLGRDHVDLRETSVDDVRTFLDNHPVIVAKMVDELMGRGIERFETQDISDLEGFIAQRLENRQFLLESFFQQHPDIAALHPQSVNTVRMITFFDGETVHLLEGVLKIGNGSHLDNFGAGGMYTVLSDDGKVIYPAFDKEGNAFSIHPLTKKDIVGFNIPLYEDILSMLDRAAREVPTIQFVGWDVAVGVTKPALIEGNYNSGVFQMKPSLTGVKTGLYPKFKKITNM